VSANKQNFNFAQNYHSGLKPSPSKAQRDDQELSGQKQAVQELVLQVPKVGFAFKYSKNANSHKSII
jgi:hypothetical protein